MIVVSSLLVLCTFYKHYWCSFNLRVSHKYCHFALNELQQPAACMTSGTKTAVYCIYTVRQINHTVVHIVCELMYLQVMSGIWRFCYRKCVRDLKKTLLNFVDIWLNPESCHQSNMKRKNICACPKCHWHGNHRFGSSFKHFIEAISSL